MTLFLIDKNDQLHRIPMDLPLQGEVNLLLQNQYLNFTNEVEFTDFQGSYKAQPGELNQIQEYTLPEEVTFALNNVPNVDILDLDADIAPKALMASIDVDGETVVVFQKVDARQVLEPSYSLMQSGEVFTKVDDRVLTLNKKIDAAHVNGNLIFFSFSQIRSFLPVVEYYEEATSGDIDLFVEVEHFAFTDEEKFRNGLSALSRKKIKMIHDNNVLELSTPKKIKKQSKKYGIDVQYNDDGHVIFPKNVSKCKELISFLNEEFATAVLTKRKIKMNSKKYL